MIALTEDELKELIKSSVREIINDNIVLAMIDELIRQDYIIQRRGFGDKKNTCRKTLLIPTAKLLKRMSSVRLKKMSA